MSTTFPDYAKTTNPEVIEAIRETLRRREDFFKRMRSLSEKLTSHSDKAMFGGWPLVKQYMTGISDDVNTATLPGRWKQPDRGVLRPFKNNPILAEIEGVNYGAVDIPGRENLALGFGRMGTGTVFEHAGAVYSHWGFEREPMSEKNAAEAEEYGWTEILASEYHAARESELAQRQKETE